MNPITRVKTTLKKDLASLKALLKAYNSLAQESDSLNHQIVQGVAQRVLDSDEISNAMNYAKIRQDELLKLTIEHADELMELSNSQMAGLVIYQNNSTASLMDDMAQLGENLVSAYDEVSDQTASAVGRLIAGVMFAYITVNTVLGITQGAFAVLATNLFFIFTVLLGIWIEVRRNNNQWVISEVDADSMARTVIAPFIREQINAEMRKADLDDSFNITIAPGLNELSDREQIVETATMRRVRTLLNTMTYGSIGISGARGTGKSVLLRAFCDERLRRHDLPEFGVLVSAPVDYDGRDFILHLFSTLCLRVIALADTSRKATTLRRITIRLCQLGMITGGFLIAAEAGVKLSRSEVGFAERFAVAMIIVLIVFAVLTRFTGVNIATWTRHATTEPSNIRPTTPGPMKDRMIAMLIAGAIMMITIVGAGIFLKSKVYVAPNSLAAHILSEKRFWPGVAVSGFALVVGIVSSVVPYNRKGGPSNIAGRAREQLRRIESIRTVTSGQSANVGFGSQLQLKHSRGSQLTERDLSLPAIVDLYRVFTIEAVTWWRTRHSGQGRVVIGIDELDKITNTESAERFLNEIKAVFDIPGCLYIVSTSQDALLQFERRSIGFRSAFDSAFDDIIRVDTLSLIDTQQLLLKRLAGVSLPFIVLCHIFSGGLSRDVLRSARTIVEARCNGFISLMEICVFLISREIVDMKKALLTTYSSQAGLKHGRLVEGAFVGTLLNDQWPGTDSCELLSAATPSLRDASPEMHAALCFLATVYDLGLNENRNPWTNYFVPGVTQDGVEDLSAARRWLSSDPKTALELVQIARGKLGLEPLACENGDLIDPINDAGP